MVRSRHWYSVFLSRRHAELVENTKKALSNEFANTSDLQARAKQVESLFQQQQSRLGSLDKCVLFAWL